MRPGEDSDDVDDRQRAEGDRNRDERVLARRHSRGPRTASVASSSSGRGARSWRSTDSTTDHARSTATSAPSRHTRRGGFAGRGSAHSERSTFVTIGPA